MADQVHIPVDALVKAVEVPTPFDELFRVKVTFVRVMARIDGKPFYSRESETVEVCDPAVIERLKAMFQAGHNTLLDVDLAGAAVAHA